MQVKNNLKLRSSLQSHAVDTLETINDIMKDIFWLKGWLSSLQSRTLIYRVCESLQEELLLFQKRGRGNGAGDSGIQRFC